MATVDRVLPWRRQAAAPADEVAPVVAAYRARHPKASHLDDHPGVRGRGERARRAVPQVRRAVHQPSGRRRSHRRRARARRDDRVGGVAPRRGRRHRGHARRRAARVRRRGRVDRRRCHEARADPVRLEGGAAGRHDAQDAGGDGEGPARPDHQAVRPAAQHAHHRGVSRAEATAHRAGDARHLRAARASPRHAGDEAAARGPRVRVAAPEALRRDRPHGLDSQRPSATSTSTTCSSTCARGSRSCGSRPRSRVGRSTSGASTRRWS